jgi:peptidoglycan/LPS O-acetylase OafA/YrhL
MPAMEHSKRYPGESALPLIDHAKAVASLLIVWHHFALYGPLSDGAAPLLGAVRLWLVEHGRLAVQVFLVIGGFLAARTLLASPAAGAGRGLSGWPPRIGRRWLRLAPAYGVALVAALAAAWLARDLIDEPSLPSEPSGWQILANTLMLQDLVGVEALSAGFWYVAIDFQLYALLALLCALRAVVTDDARRRRWTALGLMAGVAASLWFFNRESGLDVWAIYFFGAYGLGVLAQWARADARWSAVIALLVMVALMLEWRSRIALAGVVALVLAFMPDGRARVWRCVPLGRLAAFMSRISYAVFLMHYPVYLVVGALVAQQWPRLPDVHLVGLGVAFLLSIAAGWALQATIDRIAAWRRVSAARRSAPGPHRPRPAAVEAQPAPHPAPGVRSTAA